MIRYVPSAAAEPLSNALWSLTRPPEVRTPADTQYLFPWIDDLQSPAKRWLIVETDMSIPVHADAILDGIGDVLQPWIDAGHLPADTNTTLAALIESKRGQSLVVYEAFPQFFKDQSKTLEEMISAGWLAAPGVTP